MKTISVIGLDLAKNNFHLHGVSETEEEVTRKKLRRSEVLKYFANLKSCLVGMEACGGSNYWAREIRKLGHKVKLMSPQFVKPYVKGNKNDFKDAEAICEAVQRPSMRFVSEKSLEQLDTQLVHRIRARLIRNRTAVINEVRGFLQEYGVVLKPGVKSVGKNLCELCDDRKNGLTEKARVELQELAGELREIQKRIDRLEKQLKVIFESNEICRRIEGIPGIGIITATAVVSMVANADDFKSGRQLSAFFGLVPRQYSTGGVPMLLGISKRGDSYLRSLLIHGGRAVVRCAKNKEDSYSKWIAEKEKTRGKNKAAVAVANKNARIIWKMLKTGAEYKAVA